MCSKRKAADALKIPHSPLQLLLKNRKKVFIAGGVRKRHRSGNNPEVEAALARLIHTMREKNAPLSGPIVKAKALEFAQLTDKPDLKVSEGWFYRFMRKNNLCTKRLHGEGSPADEVSRKEWLDEIWPQLREEFPDDVWNADESRIFFRPLPTTTLTFQDDTRRGGKLSKEGITVLFCCPMSGNKGPPLVIGKAKSPLCFKNKKVPPDYVANGKGLDDKRPIYRVAK